MDLAFLEQVLEELPQLRPQEGWAGGIKETCECPEVQANRTIVYFKDRTTDSYREAAADYKEEKLISTTGGGKKDTLEEGLFEELQKAREKELAGAAPPQNLEREAQRMLKQSGA